MVENTRFVNGEIGGSIFRSLGISCVSVGIVIVLSYFFSFWTSIIKNNFWRLMIIFLVTSPLWSSVFVKLIGLKSFFDLINGEFNSTKGGIYVIVGLIYINLPLAIINFHSVFSNVPKNILQASLDLGRNKIDTFFKILVPYTKESILASVFLVFFPAFTSVSVADFMNANQNSKLIGQMIFSYSEYGVSDNITRQRMSFLVIFFTGIIFLLYLSIKFTVPD